MLALQFILGMLLNVIGNEGGGTKHTVYTTILIAHILNALGLVEGGIYIALRAQSKLSWWATAAVCIAFCSGILTVLTKQDIWSFCMACGFLASSWLYVVLYMRTDRAVQSSTLH